MWKRIDRLSKALLITSKEVDTTRTPSHDLLLRGGFIRQSSQGMYTLLPFGLRVLEKLERIIDEELSTISNKLSMPCLLSTKNWKITKRCDTPETFKVKDRKSAEFLLAPTHEEEVTALVASLITSYRQLPMSVYQIGKKYRDEMRPRSGLLRAKEFVMKDMYSFHTTENDALKYYEIVSKAYHNILKRIEIPFAVVEADTGSIGGRRSHEYQLLSPHGEDHVLVCTGCSYSANIEKAVSKISIPTSEEITIQVPAYDHAQVDEIISVLKQKLLGNAKIVFGRGTSELYLLVIPPNRTVNETKLIKNANIDIKLLKEQDVFERDMDIAKVIIDEQIAIKDHEYSVFDIINSEKGDLCASCGSVLEQHKAIEVAHTFYLGTKYSSALEATFKSSTQQQVPFQMGCYGIGVSRLIAAVVEASHDSQGMIWPRAIAPYDLCVIYVPKDKEEIELGKILELLSLEIPSLFQERNVILDDRDVSFGFKMKDALLVGYPNVLVIGKAYHENGLVELHHRKIGKQTIPFGEIKNYLLANDLRDKN